MSWCIGILITLLLMRIVRLKVSGFIAVLFLTVIPYFVGKFVLMLAGVQ